MNKQNVHNNRCDCEECNGLGGIRQSPTRDCDNRAHARNPEDRPRQLVFAARILPRRRECRNGTEEHHTETRHDSENRITEDLPEHDAENGTA